MIFWMGYIFNIVVLICSNAIRFLRKFFLMMCVCSCIIARNLLSGLKSCLEVYDYLHSNLAFTPCESDTVENSSSKDNHGASPQNKVCKIFWRLWIYFGRMWLLVCWYISLYHRSKSYLQDQGELEEGVKHRGANIH